MHRLVGLFLLVQLGGCGGDDGPEAPKEYDARFVGDWLIETPTADRPATTTYRLLATGAVEVLESCIDGAAATVPINTAGVVRSTTDVHGILYWGKAWSSDGAETLIVEGGPSSRNEDFTLSVPSDLSDGVTVIAVTDHDEPWEPRDPWTWTYCPAEGCALQCP